MRTPEEIARAIELLEYALSVCPPRNREDWVSVQMQFGVDLLGWVNGGDGGFIDVLAKFEQTKKRGDAVRKAQAN